MKVTEVLDHYEIQFSQLTSRNLLAVQCPFCEKKMGSPGRKLNGAIFKDYGNFTCWRCGTRVTFKRFLWAAKGIRYEEFDGFIKANLTDMPVKARLDEILSRSKPIEEPLRKPEPLEWPVKGCEPIFKYMNNPLVRRFMKKRRFRAVELIQYKTMLGLAGVMMHRLVIPIMDIRNLKVLSYTGRDLTGKADEPYRFPPGIPSHQHLYVPPGRSEFHGCRPHRVYLVEGCFDAWAVAAVTPDMVMALMGKRLYDNHLYNLQKQLPPDCEIYIMLDHEPHAQRDAEHWAALLRNHFPYVRVLRTPPPHDPASMPRQDLKQFIRSRLCENHQNLIPS